VHSLIIECEDSVDSQPWLYTDNDLQNIFPLLSKMSKISVNGRVQPDDEHLSGKANLSWTSLSPSLRSALVTLIRSGSIVDLELGGFSRIPVSSIIDSNSRLKKLSLLPLYLVDEAPSTSGEVVPASRVHLEDIKIKQSAVALRRTADWLLSPTCHLDVGELKRLHFDVSTLDDHRQVSRIVDLCATSLDHLAITPGPEVNTIRHLVRPVSPPRTGVPAFSLADLSTLKSLKVNTNIHMFKLNNNRFSDPLPWITSLLSTVPEDNELVDLELSFALQLSEQVLEQVSFRNLSHELLSEKFSKLRRITFSFPPVDTESNERLFWVEDTLQRSKYLYPLLESGLLHIAV